MSRPVRAVVLALGATCALAGITMIALAWSAFPVDDPVVMTLTIGAFPIISLGAVALAVVAAADRHGRG